MPRPRQTISGDTAAGMLLGALFGGLAGSLAGRTPTGGVALGASAGALVGLAAASGTGTALPLDLALQQHASGLGLRFISATRKGPRSLELTILHGGVYYPFKAEAPSTLATQDEVDDKLYDTLAQAVKTFHEQRQQA